MAISSNAFTLLLAFLSLFFHLNTCSQIASDQIKLWSENVQNKMPNSIVKKLSPLSQKDCDYFTNMMSNNDVNKFTADSNFCSLAKLACSSALNSLLTTKNSYTTEKTYGISRLFHTKSTNEDPFSFFRLSTLNRGNLVHLPNLKESMPDRAFLPLKISSKISLASTDNILKIFPTSQTTTKESIEISVSYCNAEKIKGETKSCSKSLEEMIKFAKFALGAKRLLSLSSKSTEGSNSELMIKNLKKVNADKIVACHELFFPFATYFCHSLSSTKLYVVDFVELKTGAGVNTMLAICHMDTSPWPADHVAFQILKFGPGEGEACHWFSRLDLAWIAE